MPPKDFCFTVVVAVFWLSASAAWANGLSAMKSVMAGDWIYTAPGSICEKNTNGGYIFTEVKSCALHFTDRYAGANISVVIKRSLKLIVIHYLHTLKWFFTIPRSLASWISFFGVRIFGFCIKKLRGSRGWRHPANSRWRDKGHRSEQAFQGISCSPSIKRIATGTIFNITSVYLTLLGPTY